MLQKMEHGQDSEKTVERAAARIQSEKIVLNKHINKIKLKKNLQLKKIYSGVGLGAVLHKASIS